MSAIFDVVSVWKPICKVVGLMFLMVSDASSKVEQPEISDDEQEPGIGRWKGALYVACGVATLYEDDAEPGTGNGN